MTIEKLATVPQYRESDFGLVDFESHPVIPLYLNKVISGALKA